MAWRISYLLLTSLPKLPYLAYCTGTAAPAPAEQEMDIEAEAKPQVLVMWGNVLYEQSALKVKRHGMDSDWKSELVDAVQKFKSAGCGDADISGALGRHPAGEDARSAIKAAGIEIQEVR